MIASVVALWRAVYGPSATERPLGNIHKEKGFLFFFLGGGGGSPGFYLIMI